MMKSNTDAVVEPSTPTRCSRPTASRSIQFGFVTPPTTPIEFNKWTSNEIKTTIPTGPIFCCTANQINIEEEPFVDFANAVPEGINTSANWAQIDLQDFDHMIELAASPIDFTQEQSTRYFVFFNRANEYQEVDPEFLERLQVTRQASYAEQNFVTCVKHQQKFQLSRYECAEAEREGLGLKNVELSPQQFSREKRKIMARKISYGNNDRIEEVTKILSTARQEDIEAISRRLSFGRKEQVADVARRLSHGKEREKEVDLQLAHVSLHYSDSGVF